MDYKKLSEEELRDQYRQSLVEDRKLEYDADKREDELRKQYANPNEVVSSEDAALLEEFQFDLPFEHVVATSDEKYEETLRKYHKSQGQFLDENLNYKKLSREELKEIYRKKFEEEERKEKERLEEELDELSASEELLSEESQKELKRRAKDAAKAERDARMQKRIERIEAEMQADFDQLKQFGSSETLQFFDEDTAEFESELEEYGTTQQVRSKIATEVESFKQKEEVKEESKEKVEEEVDEENVVVEEVKQENNVVVNQFREQASYILSDMDKASAAFTSVKEVIRKLDSICAKEPLDKGLLVATLTTAQRTVSTYYNQNKGFKFSKKGQRRRDRTKEMLTMLSEMQKEFVPEVNPEAVSAPPFYMTEVENVEASYSSILKDSGNADEEFMRVKSIMDDMLSRQDAKDDMVTAIPLIMEAQKAINACLASKTTSRSRKKELHSLDNSLKKYLKCADVVDWLDVSLEASISKLNEDFSYENIIKHPDLVNKVMQELPAYREIYTKKIADIRRAKNLPVAFTGFGEDQPYFEKYRKRQEIYYRIERVHEIIQAKEEDRAALIEKYKEDNEMIRTVSKIKAWAPKAEARDIVNASSYYEQVANQREQLTEKDIEEYRKIYAGKGTMGSSEAIERVLTCALKSVYRNQDGTFVSKQDEENHLWNRRWIESYTKKDAEGKWKEDRKQCLNELWKELSEVKPCELSYMMDHFNEYLRAKRVLLGYDPWRWDAFNEEYARERRSEIPEIFKALDFNTPYLHMTTMRGSFISASSGFDLDSFKVTFTNAADTPQEIIDQVVNSTLEDQLRQAREEWPEENEEEKLREKQQEEERMEQPQQEEIMKETKE